MAIRSASVFVLTLLFFLGWPSILGCHPDDYSPQRAVIESFIELRTKASTCDSITNHEPRRPLVPGYICHYISIVNLWSCRFRDRVNSQKRCVVIDLAIPENSITNPNLPISVLHNDFVKNITSLIDSLFSLIDP